MEILTFNEADFAKSAANFLERQINALLKERDTINIAVSGGKSPIPMYEALRTKDINWAKINFFLVDERCVELGSSDSNFETLRQCFFKHIKGEAHPILTKAVSFEHMANNYEEKIRELLPEKNGLPSFDLILLGMGLDGHTASLFPGTKALHNKLNLVTYNEVPQMPNNRITFTFPLVLNAKKIILIVKGPEKLKTLNSSRLNNAPIAKLVPVINYVLN